MRTFTDGNMDCASLTSAEMEVGSVELLMLTWLMVMAGALVTVMKADESEGGQAYDMRGCKSIFLFRTPATVCVS